MGALCKFTPYLDYNARVHIFSGLYLFSKQLYSGSYTVRIASLQGNHGYFSQSQKQKQKQDKMKLENIWGEIQSPFPLLLSTVHSFILFTLHN